MTRVVFAWELGAFLGHVERNLAVAQHLRQQGAKVHFIVSNLPTAEKLLAPEGFPYLPAPGFRRPQVRPKTAINTSELLADLGYEDEETLRALARSWLELWRLLKPDVIVTDYAPSATLSAKIAAIPNLPLGPGFSIPPGLDPMPAFHEEQRNETARLRAADQRLLPAINSVAKTFGHSGFACVGGLFDNAAAQITSFPELDPFGPRKDAHYVGPVKAGGRFKEAKWRNVREHRVFAYLQPTMVGLDAVLAGLRAPDCEVIGVIPGAPQRILNRFQNEEFRIETEPVQLEGLLPYASIVVNYASAGIVSGALQAGVPMLLHPTFLEHQLTASRAVRCGAAVAHLGNPSQEKVAEARRELLAIPNYRQAAQSFAKKYGNYSQRAAIVEVGSAILGSAIARPPLNPRRTCAI